MIGGIFCLLMALPNIYLGVVTGSWFSWAAAAWCVLMALVCFNAKSIAGRL